MAIHLPIVTKYSDQGFKQAKKDIKGFGSSLKGLAGGFAAGLSLSALASGLQAAGKAAAEDTKSSALLANQLRNSTGATDLQIASTEEYIRAMQLQTAIADDELRPAMSALVMATGDVTKAQDLLSLATDLAAAKGIGLQTAANAIAKATAGQTTQLFRLVPTLRNAGDWMQALQMQTKGAAVAAAENDPYQRLNVIMGELQEQIGVALLPNLNELADWLTDPETQAGIQSIIQSFTDLIDDASLAAEGVFYLTDAISGLFEDLGGIQLPPEAQSVFDEMYNEFYRISIPIGLIVTALQALGRIRVDTNAIIKGSGFDTTTLKGILEASGGKLTPDGLTPTPPPGPPEKNPVAEFYKGLADEVRKQTARIKLEALGASEGLIDSVISGADWEKVYRAVAKSGLKGVRALQVQFNKTKEGIAELTAAEEEAKKAAEEAAEAARIAAEEFAASVQVLNGSMAEATKSLVGLFNVRREMGQFETEVVSAFDAIGQTITQAFSEGRLLQKSASELQAYADKESQILQGIARQREALAAKKDMIVDWMQSVKSAVVGLADVNNFIDRQSVTVTETITRTVGAMRLTTTRTVEEIRTTNSIVDGFKGILEKTRRFVENLKRLRELGLSADIFRDIVEAGVDAGGATAEALASGSSATVEEINSLYSQIADAGSKLAEQTAQSLYGDGINLAQGILQGIQSQEEALRLTAESLATAFAEAFNSKFASALQLTAPGAVTAVAPLAPIAAENMNFGLGGRGVTGNLAFKAASVGSTNVNVTVNAGLGADGNRIGEAIVEHIRRYERTSGQVFARVI